MTWAYVSQGAWAEGADTSALSVPYPGSIVAGGMLSLVLATRYESGTIDTPSGFTLIARSGAAGVRVYGKIASGSESGSLSCSVTSGNGDRFFGQMAFFSGAPSDLSASIHASAATGTYGSVDINVDPLTISQANTLVLAAGVKRANITTFTAMPSGFTKISERANTSGNASCVVWAYSIQTTATSIGSGQKFDSASTSTADGYSVIGSVLTGTGGATSKYLKLLAHSSAASATGIEGVVLNAARDTVIGEFAGQAFEASLESGEAVLLIPVADITPDGSALTTTDTPLVAAYNSTYGTAGLGSATVIEV